MSDTPPASRPGPAAGNLQPVSELVSAAPAAVSPPGTVSQQPSPSADRISASTAPAEAVNSPRRRDRPPSLRAPATAASVSESERRTCNAAPARPPVTSFRPFGSTVSSSSERFSSNVDLPELAEARILFRLHCRRRLRDAIWRVVFQVRMMRRLRRIQAAVRESAALAQTADSRAARRGGPGGAGPGGAGPYAVEVPPHIEELLEDMEIEFREEEQAAEAQRLQHQEGGESFDSDGASVETDSSLLDSKLAEPGAPRIASSDASRGSSRPAAAAAET